jgi:HD-GYP domain
MFFGSLVAAAHALLLVSSQIHAALIAHNPICEVTIGMASVRISIARLKPGMFVVDAGISWIEAPNLYQNEGLITSEAEIKAIKRQGFAEVCYDPTRSQISQPLPESKSVPQTPLSDEIYVARGTFSAAYDHVRFFMQNAASGNVEVAAVEPCLCSIVKSVARNRNALLLLANLKNLDDYMYRHSVNVAIFAVAFGQYLGLEDEELRLVGLAALFHDYGKALLPPTILNAPRRLDADEMQIMRTHVDRGYEKLRISGKFPELVLSAILQHHERHDGTGYPQHLAGDEIGLYGRIISICDVYDALASKRVYKDAIHPKHALGTLFKMSESAWAPGFAEHFIKMVGIFPIGTAVLLSNGQKGIVCHSEPLSPSLPSVLLVRDCEHGVRPHRLFDLSRQKTVSVNRSLSKTETAYWDISALLDTANEEEMA